MRKNLTGLIIIFFGISAVVTPLSLVMGDISQYSLLDSNDTSKKEDPHKKSKVVLKVCVDFDPNTLNAKSRGKWVTVFIHFSDKKSITDVQFDSILLNNELPAEKISIETGGDDDFDELSVKFDRFSVINILEPADVVEITISGKFNGGGKFEGKDSIKLINF